MNRIGPALLLWALGASSAQALSSAPSAPSAPSAASSRLTEKPVAGQVLRAGETTTLRFSVDEEVDEMEILLSLSGGDTFPLRVTREMSAGTYEVKWRVPNFPTTRARLALRVGSEEEGEVIRDASDEFTILADTGPLEDARPFRGEWRTGEALQEMPPTAPFEAPDLAGAPESIRALRHETYFDRTRAAAASGAPPDVEPQAVEPVHRASISPPTSPRVPRNLPKRE